VATRANRTTLTRESIAATALALLDRDGLDALSMRRLADELGVGTMTLYGYFRSKGELLDAVLDASVVDSGVLHPEGSWRERATALARSVRANLERHPALIQIRLRQPMTRPAQFRWTEAVMQSLVDSGLPRDQAARAFRVLFTYVFGFVAFSPAGAADESRTAVRTALAALPPDDYPLLSAMADEAAAAAAGDEQFDFGLELVLDGIEARAGG
jgi:AcrR family transcriptional regulator